MAAFKYQNCRYLSTFFGEELFHMHRLRLLCRDADAILPVPIHRKKHKKRGYNQAELLAKELSCLLHLPYYSDILIRTKDTPPQKNLHPKERFRNLRHAFAINPRQRETLAHHTNILLVDDIYTTGATAESCTRLLLENGVGRVYLCSVCIGAGD